MADWVRICDADALVPERGAAALLPDGSQVAIFKLADGELFAVGHHDPFSLANVIARGVVGTQAVDDEQVDVIQSPIYKEAFDLRTGKALKDPSVSLGTWAIRDNDGSIEIGEQLSAAQAVAQAALAG